MIKYTLLFLLLSVAAQATELKHPDWKNATVQDVRKLMQTEKDTGYLLLEAIKENAQSDIIRFLIESGAEEKRKKLALMIAAGYNRDPQVINMLLNAGVNVNISTSANKPR